MRKRNIAREARRAISLTVNSNRVGLFLILRIHKIIRLSRRGPRRDNDRASRADAMLARGGGSRRGETRPPGFVRSAEVREPHSSIISLDRWNWTFLLRRSGRAD